MLPTPSGSIGIQRKRIEIKLYRLFRRASYVLVINRQEEQRILVQSAEGHLQSK